ncbi:MAG TPA: nucleotidyl transferase AbiEii/AbiGii toxin family protein [Thermoanaerobaculia bacterium]|nr:nucleotidyl transferase AbiEii/AbiGii toxin family protein [Thermoanaerobaculia bacterium]
MVGGLAVSARAEPRFTRDVDLAVAVDDDAHAERLVRSLQSAGYLPLEVIEQEATGRLATVRLQPPGGDEHGVVLDLLFASSGIEPELVARATSLEVFPELALPVARLSDLIAVNVLARDDEERPQDAADLCALKARAADSDLVEARRALELISGYHRNRGLRARLEGS